METNSYWSRRKEEEEENERLTSKHMNLYRLREDAEYASKYGPRRFSEFIGQHKPVMQLKMAISASNLRGDLLEHILMSGPPGIGKTTLARIIGAEKNVPIVECIGPNITSPFIMQNIIMTLPSGNPILFIDEIHRVDEVAQDVCYGAMENLKIGDELIRPFTLIGATTLMDKINDPLIDRFGLNIVLDYYNKDDLTKIVQNSSTKMKMVVELNGSWQIADSSRGTPRLANRLLRRVRDYNNVNKPDEINNMNITLADVMGTLDVLEVSVTGLEKMHIRYLDALCLHYPNPVGERIIAQMIGVSPKTVKFKIEPWLVSLGFIHIGSQGRELTDYALDQHNQRYGLREKIMKYHGGKMPVNPKSKKKGAVQDDVQNDLDDFDF